MIRAWNRLRITLLSLIMCVLSASASSAERWALIYSVSTYDDPKIPGLMNTVNDGRTMAAVLNQMGFEIYYLEDGDRATFYETVEKISAEQQDSELGFFYFAGHGLQVSGENFALPSDIQTDRIDFLEEDGISIGNVLRRLKGSGVENLVVVLDACRNSPFTDTEAAGTGLALVDAPDNTVIAYSTAPGELALDGTGANSPYTAALATALEAPEQDIRDALRLVRARVRLATGGTQTPWFVDNSKGEITIRADSVGRKFESLPILTYDEVSLPATAWWTIANSADPRDFQTYLTLFPQAKEAESAQRQLSLVGSEDQANFPLMELGVPSPNPEVPGGLSSIITACDILATGLHAPMNLVEPVPHDLVNERAALRACTEAVHNDPENARLLGLLARVLFLQERYPEALYYNELAAENGSTMAYGALATMYRLGLGVDVDLEEAANLVRKGALGGAAEMRVLMGVYYREGWGVPQSFNEARRWFEIAARVGNTSALSALGDLYLRGQLGRPDPATANSLYVKAAALGKTDAMNSLGMAYLEGKGVEQDIETGIRYLSQASELGNPHAAFQLGRVFWRGIAVERNPTQALAYFRLSAQRNNLIAYVLIGDVLRSSGDTSEAYANYVIAREGGLLRNTIGSRDISQIAVERLAKLSAEMSAADIEAGETIAQDWIEQYGLLDFNLVNE